MRRRGAGFSKRVDPAASEMSWGCPLVFRCLWCSYRWARGGSETVAAVGLKGLRG
jgi:hypothetical protein